MATLEKREIDSRRISGNVWPQAWSENTWVMSRDLEDAVVISRSMPAVERAAGMFLRLRANRLGLLASERGAAFGIFQSAEGSLDRFF
jgi:hypothetical protein